MSTSIFSSFDVLFAESFGQKVGFSWAPTKVEKNATDVDRKGALSSIQSTKKDNERNSLPLPSPSPSPSNVNKRQQQPRRPRFAPELDGVNCFETIIRY